VDSVRSNSISSLNVREGGAKESLARTASAVTKERNSNPLAPWMPRLSGAATNTATLEGLSPLPTRETALRTHLPSLDGLRGVAILAVFLFHYAGGAPKQSHSLFTDSISMAIEFGWTGVDLFFVLSGFLITGILIDTRSQTNYYKNFYARRILRIFPAYYLMLTAYLLLTPFLHMHWKAGHLFFLAFLGYPAALLWPNLQIISPFVVVAHLWSLSSEEQFYLFWPWIIAKLKSHEAILWLCAALGGGAILLRTAIIVSHGLDPSWAYGFLPCRMDALALGASLAISMRGPWRRRLPEWGATSFVIASGVLVILFGMRHSVDRYDPLVATIGYSVTALAYGALLLGSLKPRGWLERVFSTMPLRLVGKYSYGMYLYHLPIAAILHPLKEYFVAETHSFVAGSAVYLTSAFAINLIVAGSSFHLIESPILRFKSHFES
jgi:peptidoglycan/LPS O-acetylase OafA/YrhL